MGAAPRPRRSDDKSPEAIDGRTAGRDKGSPLEAARRECCLEADGHWMTEATEGTEMALWASGIVLGDTMESLSTGIAQYAACKGARTKSIVPGNTTEKARTEFGDQLIQNSIELVWTIIEMRTLIRRMS